MSIYLLPGQVMEFNAKVSASNASRSNAFCSQADKGTLHFACRLRTPLILMTLVATGCGYAWGDSLTTTMLLLLSSH